MLRNNRTDLCKNTLSKEIHHNPTKGGHSEGKKFDGFYTATLELYKGTFKTEPPKTIWPDNEKRFSDINFQRVNLKNYWLLRRPRFSKKTLFLFLLLFISFLSIQASSDSETWTFIAFIAVAGILIYNVVNNKNGGSGSGCSPGSSGCGGDHGHSGCGGDSGCGGGCSGCGGCGGD